MGDNSIVGLPGAVPHLFRAGNESLTWDDACYGGWREGLQVATNQKPTFLFLPNLPNIVPSLWQQATAARHLADLGAQLLSPTRIQSRSRAVLNQSCVSVTVHGTSRHGADLDSLAQTKPSHKLEHWAFSLRRAGTTGAFAVLSRLTARFGERRRGGGRWYSHLGCIGLVFPCSMSHYLHFHEPFRNRVHPRQTSPTNRRGLLPGFRFPPSGS